MYLDIPQLNKDRKVTFVSLHLPSRVLSKQYRQLINLYEAASIACQECIIEPEWLDECTLLYRGLTYECGEA